MTLASKNSNSFLRSRATRAILSQLWGGLGMIRAVTAFICAGLGALLVALTACTTVPGEYCTNNDYLQKPFFKAMARSSDNQCYWVWSRSDQATADADVLNNCRRERLGCALVRRGNQYIGDYEQPSGSTGGATAANFFQGLAAGALMAGGNPAAGAMLMSDLANQSSQPPAYSTPAGQGDQTCFDRRQNEIAARFKPRVNAAIGICQQGTVSRDMWQQVLNAAIACNMPEATRAYARSNIAQSQATMRSSCVR